MFKSAVYNFKLTGSISLQNNYCKEENLLEQTYYYWIPLLLTTRRSSDDS